MIRGQHLCYIRVPSCGGDFALMRAYMVRHTLLFRLSSIGSRHLTRISRPACNQIRILQQVLKKAAIDARFFFCELL
jgi:hypothetical protein